MAKQSKYSKKKQKVQFSRRRFLKLMPIVIPILALASYTVGSNWVDISQHQVPLPGILADLRVLVLSDTHLPSCYVSPEYIEKINQKFDPHLILILGDSIDQKGNEAQVSYFRNLQASLGKFAIVGNWEYWGNCDLDSLKQHYAQSGFQLLLNEMYSFPHSGGFVHIIGLDDFLGGSPDFSLFNAYNGQDPLLIMSHCPASFDQLPNFPSITLSGHTHGGQITPLGLKIILPRGSGNYVEGWYQEGSRRLFVSRGLGNSLIPLRIGARPEIALISLVPTS